MKKLSWVIFDCPGHRSGFCRFGVRELRTSRWLRYRHRCVRRLSPSPHVVLDGRLDWH